MTQQEPGESTEAISEVLEDRLLGGEARYTRLELAERSGVPLETAQALWRSLGFAQVDDDTVAFNDADLEALGHAQELIDSGLLDEGSRDALVRTWGRSFARLAEWQTNLLAGVAADNEDPLGRLGELTDQTIPTVDALQSYIWRRHLLGASDRLLAQPATDSPTQAVGFVDIVGYTSRSKHLDEPELLALVEHFESAANRVVNEHGGRLIKTIGDEVLYVADDLLDAVRVARTLTEQHDEDEDFPEVRGGVAYGAVSSRLGDVFGPTVNIASRLTSLARPGTVLVDSGARQEIDERDPDDEEFYLRRLRRASVKGYHHIEVWAVRRPR